MASRAELFGRHGEPSRAFLPKSSSQNRAELWLGPNTIPLPPCYATAASQINFWQFQYFSVCCFHLIRSNLYLHALLHSFNFARATRWRRIWGIGGELVIHFGKSWLTCRIWFKSMFQALNIWKEPKSTSLFKPLRLSVLVGGICHTSPFSHVHRSRRYSSLSNNRAGWNKRAGWKISQN